MGEYDTSKDVDCVESPDADSKDCADPPVDLLVSREFKFRFKLLLKGFEMRSLFIEQASL